MRSSPNVVLLGGPNGAGKSTAAAGILTPVFGIDVFVNADVIARGLGDSDSEGVAIRAGRAMLEQLRSLAEARESFAFESTLSSRSFAPWLTKLVESGYEFHLIYVWLRSAELAVQRVKYRAAHGGHLVPPDVVRRRYQRSCANFVNRYASIATSWRVYDNSVRAKLIAYQSATGTRVIVDPASWSSLNEIAARQEEKADELA